VSVGVAGNIGVGNAEALLRAADRALYTAKRDTAKRAGCNRVVVAAELT